MLLLYPPSNFFRSLSCGAIDNGGLSSSLFDRSRMSLTGSHPRGRYLGRDVVGERNGRVVFVAAGRLLSAPRRIVRIPSASVRNCSSSYVV